MKIQLLNPVPSSGMGRENNGVLPGELRETLQDIRECLSAVDICGAVQREQSIGKNWVCFAIARLTQTEVIENHRCLGLRLKSKKRVYHRVPDKTHLLRWHALGGKIVHRALFRYKEQV